MEIPEAAAAFFDVGLLEENGVRVFLMAIAEILAAEFEKRLLALADAIVVEAFLEAGKEFQVAGDEAGVHERGFVFLICLRLLDALGDRAAGVADLEADIPEDVKNVLDELLKWQRKLGGGAGEEEEDVDVRTGIERAATVATRGDEGDRKELATFPGIQ